MLKRLSATWGERVRRPAESRRASLRAFLHDEGGVSLASFAVTFGLILMLFFGASTILQIITIKSSMAGAVYDATQHLIYEGRRYRQPSDWAPNGIVEREVRRIIMERLGPMSLIRSFAQIDIDNPLIDVVPPTRAALDDLCDSATDDIRPLSQYSFQVRMRLDLEPSQFIPFFGRAVQFPLVEQASGHVECPRGNWNPTPVKEPCLFPGFFGQLLPNCR